MEIDHQKDRKWLTILIIVFSIIVYSFHKEIDILLNKEHYFWFVGNSMFIFLLTCQILLLSKKKLIPLLLFGLAMNNMFDELFFDPLTTGINEYATGVLILLLIIKIGIKNESRNKT